MTAIDIVNILGSGECGYLRDVGVAFEYWIFNKPYHVQIIKYIKKKKIL